MNYLTTDDVLKAVNEIYHARHDPEAAHGLEDALHLRVLSAIARDAAIDPQGCAEMALRTQGIDFERWCA